MKTRARKTAGLSPRGVRGWASGVASGGWVGAGEGGCVSEIMCVCVSLGLCILKKNKKSE